MEYPSHRLAVARDAIEIVFRRPNALPQSREVDGLRARAQAGRGGNSWIKAPPSDENRETLMKHVLELHVEVAKLEHETRGDKRVGGCARA